MIAIITKIFKECQYFYKIDNNKDLIKKNNNKELRIKLLYQDVIKNQVSPANNPS